MVEVVMARYCEDLGWLAGLPDSWRTTIYDKSQGGPRQRITLGAWSSAAGPDAAALWPGAVPLANVGTEAHTYMHHIVEHWGSLGEYTVFLPGDALGHVPDVIQCAAMGVASDAGYVGFGDKYECDERGRPNVPLGFDELAQGFRIFFPHAELPQVFHWTGFSMYLARRDRLHRFTRGQWAQARDWCTDKVHAIAMERLHDLLLG